MAKRIVSKAAHRSQVSGEESAKYQAYLCSREWNVLREVVHKRAGGKCERCRVFPIAAVHHLSYERKYQERPEDLQGICEHCHAFTHAKSDFDPAAEDSITGYIKYCIYSEIAPLPSIIVERGGTRMLDFFLDVYDVVSGLQRSASGMETDDDEGECSCLLFSLWWKIDECAGFCISSLPDDWESWDVKRYRNLISKFGLSEPKARGFAKPTEG